MNIVPPVQNLAARMHSAITWCQTTFVSSAYQKLSRISTQTAFTQELLLYGTVIYVDAPRKLQFCETSSREDASLETTILTSSSQSLCILHNHNPRFLPTAISFISHTLFIVIILIVYFEWLSNLII